MPIGLVPLTLLSHFLCLLYLDDGGINDDGTDGDDGVDSNGNGLFIPTIK